MPRRLLLPSPLLMVALTGCLPELPDAKNVAPTAPVVAIGPTEARTDDDLVAVIATPATDAEGSLVTYTYAWRQDGMPRVDLVTDTVPASETTKGENWEVVVTPNDGDLDGVAGSAVVTILNTAPVATVAFTPEAPVTGDDLRAVPTATDADGDPVTFAYAWALDAVPQSDVSDRISAERTEHGQVWSVTVTPADAEEAGAPVVGEVAIANDPPVMLAVTLAPEAPTVRDNVVAAVESADADGDAVTYTYIWFVDGTEVQSGSGSTLPDGLFAKHQRITVEVVPNDGIDDGEALVSTDAVARNSVPTATGARIDPATATEASTLTCLPEGWEDADGDPEAWTYAWTVNGAEVATTATLDGTLFGKGDTVRCAATPFDGEENGSPVTSAPLTIANTPPVLASATLSTTSPAEADTLSVTLGAATDGDGDAVTHTYAWVVNGSVVATGSTLSGAHFDKGDTVHVVVTPTDGTDAGAPVTSDVATVVNTRPIVSGVTHSPGSVYTNDTLTATVTASDADGDTLTHTYAWYVEGALVQSGASATLAGATHFDRDEDVYVVVTPNDGDTDGASVTSSTVTVLNTAPTAPLVAITPEEPTEGDDLTCAVTAASTDADGDAVTYSFAWDVDGVAYAGATDAAMASVVDGADVGATETWACEVTPDDGADAGGTGDAFVTIMRAYDQLSCGETGACCARNATTHELTCWGTFHFALPIPSTVSVPVRSFDVAGNHMVWLDDGSGVASVYQTARQDPSCGIASTPSVSLASVESGEWGVCGVDASGSMVCWGGGCGGGCNRSGQYVAQSGTFMDVQPASNASCALRTDGSLTCWGCNDTNQINVPSPSGGSWSSVRTQHGTAVGVNSAGGVQVWGGVDAHMTSVPSGAWTAAECFGGYVPRDVSACCGIHTDGSLECWGSMYGSNISTTALGREPAGTYTELEIGTVAGTPVACALSSAGDIACWGSSTVSTVTDAP